MAVVWFILNRTTFGKNIYITGGNKEAAKVSGINVNKVIIACFIIESILVGLAGILEVARTGGANAGYGNAYEFDAISSCVVGGVSLSGGIGKSIRSIYWCYDFHIHQLWPELYWTEL